MHRTINSPCVLELLRFTEAHRRHTEALGRATGEHFNIFQILGIGHLEVKTHSPFLGELLDPQGRHGLGSIFLRLFLARFQIIDFDADSKTAKLDLEYWVGQATEKSGGRIDIVIKDGKGSTIFIENKIYAGDRKEQMRRYRAADPQAHLFYLTRHGTEPTNLSILEREGIKCRCISYARDILAWLNDCRKDAASVPVVRETITQYIHLIQELTDQSTLIRMNTELMKEILRNEESLAAFFTLAEVLESVRAELIGRLDEHLDKIASDLGLIREGKFRLGDSGSFFSAPGLDRHNLKIGYSFEKGSYRNFFYGLATKDAREPSPIAAQILSAFEAEFQVPSEKPTAWWPASAYFEYPYRDWTAVAFEAILSGHLAKSLETKFVKLAKLAKQVCPEG